MSRIEIPMDEYQGMKSRIEELEKDLASKNNEIEIYKDKYYRSEEHLEDIASLSLIERVFNWKYNLKMIIGHND